MNERYVGMKRKIKALEKTDHENSKVITNLDERNNVLLEEINTLLELDEYRKYKIQQLEGLVEFRDNIIKEQNENYLKVKMDYSKKLLLIAVIYIVGLTLLKITIG